MNYQLIFNQKLIILTVILCIGCLAVIFFWCDNSYMDGSDYLKNHPVAKYCIRIMLTILLVSYFVVSELPMIKDKKVIDSEEYNIAYGVLEHEVCDGGMFGLSKSINMHFDEKEYEFSVAYIDENIKVGDYVKITYLPNSMYAVIEIK